MTEIASNYRSRTGGRLDELSVDLPPAKLADGRAL